MSGFKHDALDDIAQLQRVLTDQYDPASIPKELVQNADDARARELHFGSWRGWPDDAHPLLRGPAILVLNDGPFRAEHLEAIQSLGLGSKGGDSASIGKFGLGMKSIFHLCEAFFYLASETQPAASGDTLCRILNPWINQDGRAGYHDDWESFRGERLIRAVKEWRHGAARWFCLYLPLRRPEQLDNKYPIVEEYPQVAEFLTPDLPERIARLFPFLRSVEAITIWQCGEGGALAKQASIELEADSRIRFRELPAGGNNRTDGRVRIKRLGSGEVEATLSFWVREAMLADAQLAALRVGPDWPERPTYDSQARRTMVKEEAWPHAGAAFSLLAAAQPDAGELDIKRAVFLPLSSTLKTLQIKGRLDFQLLLHGYYLLDAGRKDIHEGKRWNELLEQRGGLRLILPVLDDLNRGSQLPSEELYRLTEGLCRVPFVSDGIEEICVEHQWLFRLGSQDGDWSLVPAEEKFICLPEPPKDSEWTPQDLFPTLRTVAASTAITFVGWPRISRHQPSSWIEVGRWGELLSVPVEPFLQSNEQLDYFDQAIRAEKDLAPRAWAETGSELAPLLNLGRRLFRALTAESARACRDALKRFVTLLPPGTWFSFPSGEGEVTVAEHPAILKGLLDLDLKVIVVPSDVAPLTSQQPNTLPAEDALRILEWLTAALAQPKKIAAVAVEVVSGVAREERDDLLRKAGRLKVFRIDDLKLGKEIAASWDELAAWRAERTLFAPGGGLLELLQRALVDDRLYRLRPSPDRTADVLFGSGRPEACRAADCAATLLKAARLAPAEQRKPLLERLLATNVPAAAKALRYLLHAHREHIEDVSAPLLTGVEDGDVWACLAGFALAHRGGRWRLLPALLAQTLSPEQLRHLNVKLVVPQSVAELLAEAESLDWLDGASLSVEERRNVLTQIPDRQLWLRLPFHETPAGRFVPVDQHTYLVGPDNPIPPEFARVARGIQISADPTLRGIYQERVPPWTPAACIELALDQPQPEPFHEAILHAIDEAYTRGDGVTRELYARLKNCPWLPTRQGPVRPDDVIHLPRMEDPIVKLFAEPEVRGVFLDSSSVAPSVREHPGSRWLAQSFYSTGALALEKLGITLVEVPGYRLGLPASLLENVDFVPTLLEAFDDDGPPGFPVFRLLHDAAASYREQVESLIEPLLMPLEVGRLQVLVRYLAERAAHMAGEKGRRILVVHSYYLRALTQSPGFSVDSLRELNLLSRKGHWRPAHELALDGKGIDGDFLLDDAQRKILEPALNLPAAPGLPGRAQSSQPLRPLDLQTYFRLWDSRVPSQAIGGLLALLGNETSTVNLATELLKPRSLTGMREMIDWEKAPTGQGAAEGADEDIEQAMAKQRFKLYLHPSTSGTTKLLNLLGVPFDAQLADDFNDLFLDKLYFEGRVCTAEVREINPSQFTRGQLSGLLRETAAEILRRVYWRTPENFDRIWSELCHGEQLELEVAQRLILESAFFYFRQLRDRGLRSVQDWVKRWDEVRYAEAERGTSGEALARKKRSLHVELQQNLEQNRALQADVLSAVQQKIKEYQYRESSVPFELFQNADDAAAELAEMVGEEKAPAAARRFVLVHQPTRLTFLHWGRAINRFRGGKFSAADGMDRGFNRDLEKMLVLSSSDKPGEDGSTGKFGLGFKSAFLVCDKPRIASGELAVEIVGGMFPRVLEPDQSQYLKQILAENAGDVESGNLDGTGIDLELNKEIAENSERVLKLFVELAHVLPVFARKIEECILVGPQGQTQAARWESNSVGGHQGIRLGGLNPFAGSSHQGTLGLLFDCGAAGAILLGFGARAFCRLPAKMPTFWVTAPTTELLGSGIAVNGRFEVDVGRAQLARDAPANKERARLLGEKLGKLFEQLSRAAADWEVLRKDLQLAHDTTPGEFWLSLWEVLVAASIDGSSSASPAAELLRQILWADGCGMAWLLSQADTLPTGLPGRFSSLTRLPRIKYFTAGAMDRPELFQSVSAWPQFEARVPPGSIVNRAVRECLSRLLNSLAELQPLRLSDVLKWELPPSGEINAATARRLGIIVNRDLVNRLETEQQTKDDADQLRELLPNCLFRSQASTWVPAEDLVAAGEQAEDRDETLRAGFAPPERTLHGDYLATALELFRACRFRLKASSDLLAKWGCEAGDENRREAFLRYLVEGELSFPVSQIARVDRVGTWLDTVQATQAFARFNGQDQNTILGRLGFAYVPPPAADGQPATLPPTDEVRTFLKAVESWWSDKSNRVPLVQRYVRYEYPNGQSPDVSGADRKAWVVLLVRGIGYTIGRIQDSQTRGFIESCDQRGWLDTFAMDPPARSDRSEWNRRWMQILDEFALEGREHVEYLHWIKLLPVIYRIAISLDDYVNIFRGLDRGSGAQLIDPYDILNPALDEELEGGPTAPSLTQSLGLGIFFVLRELVRLGAIRGERVSPHCFVPTLQMRKSFANLGCPLNLDAKGRARLDWSSQIIEFLLAQDVQDPSFTGHFDIPFIVLGCPNWLKENDRVGRKLAQYWNRYWNRAS
jgi:hypothetical protein